MFHQQVKKKDAPNYYDVIKFPIALMDMKAKAKREDYFSRDMFMQDLTQMRLNAEQYNSPISPISDIARSLEQLAQTMIDQEDTLIKDYELLIME